jgi:site-specific DNA-methyltransferase (cytosine-N4-specific)
VEYVWWLSKSKWPKASNQPVLNGSFSADMHRLNKRGVRPTERPSGHKINASWSKIKTKGSIPSGFMEAELFEPEELGLGPPSSVQIMGNNAANDVYTMKCKEAGLKVHPARFPAKLPEFYIKMLTDENDVVLDPFAGSNTTGAVAEQLLRRWLAFDNLEEYLEASKFRFHEGCASRS